jgi:hypothetical protein
MCAVPNMTFYSEVSWHRAFHVRFSVIFLNDFEIVSVAPIVTGITSVTLLLLLLLLLILSKHGFI